MDNPLITPLIQFLSFGYGFGALFVLLVTVLSFTVFREVIPWLFRYIIIPISIFILKLFIVILCLYFGMPVKVGIYLYNIFAKKGQKSENIYNMTLISIILMLVQCTVTAVVLFVLKWIMTTELPPLQSVFEPSAKISMIAFLGANFAQMIYKLSTKKITYYAYEHKRLTLAKSYTATQTVYRLPESFFEWVIDVVTNHWFDKPHPA